MPRQWTLDDIPWDQFDRSKVDPDIVKIVRAAAMVESNARDYAAYLCSVFRDDPDFCNLARGWAEEEVQHGQALGRWAGLEDPDFDYDARFAAFRAAYGIPVDASASVRGSLAGELIARCIVEVGTSSYYTAIADATEEPVLREICRRIATDEWRHYGLFYRNLRRYLDREHLSPPRRAWIALTRVLETEDDELAQAYHTANLAGEPYDRRRASRAYSERACALYNPGHVERAIGMIFKAVGFAPHGWTSRTLSRIASALMAYRARRHMRIAKAGA
ncbi:MAG: ferritin-like domain-containing protein [Alphaproteobacteria bacterium]|nr:ferritin-like domain-containing protein [Alphaproteobacteria bacterium]MCB9931185.1 ferritin-like domain-containing protein [Alphaproteobacteria bacterium]